MGANARGSSPQRTKGTPRRTRAPREAGGSEDQGQRLNKYLAQAGVASRRKADALIDQGRVKVNGEVATEYWYAVQEGDVVEVNGRRVSPQPHLYLLLNKPKDTITTTADERGRRTVLDVVRLSEAEKQGLFPVGRLDRHTVGVLLLTNDGELAHRLMHPRYETEKLYVVRTKTPVKPHELDVLRRGVDLEDGPARADRAAYVDPERPREIGLQLHEGRNRQVRRMLEALGHEVVHLERVRYAGFTTQGLRPGKWRRLRPEEVRRLRRRVNLK